MGAESGSCSTRVLKQGSESRGGVDGVVIVGERLKARKSNGRRRWNVLWIYLIL